VYKGSDYLEVREELKDTDRCSYRYRLTRSAELVLRARLKNTESKTIEGTVFHYYFFVMNGQPTLTSL
jgi:hypothetical protein